MAIAFNSLKLMTNNSFKGNYHIITDIATNCAYCGVPLSKDYYRKEGFTCPTADHIIPYYDGGRITVACCNECNKAKKDMSLDEYVTTTNPEAISHIEDYLSGLKNKNRIINRKNKEYVFDGERYCRIIADTVKAITGITLNYFV